jgi:hypothetical protein
MLLVCGFNILYYGSVSARLSEKPRFRFGFIKTEPQFRFGFSFAICFPALSFPLMHFNNVFVNYDDIEKMSKGMENLKDWKLKRGCYFESFCTD